jgi:hypothetical protein
MQSNNSIIQEKDENSDQEDIDFVSDYDLISPKSEAE